jgi:hypothetical protein
MLYYMPDAELFLIPQCYITEKSQNGYNGNYLIACFSMYLTENTPSISLYIGPQYLHPLIVATIRKVHSECTLFTRFKCM